MTMTTDLEKLADQIRYHNEKYFNDQPEITDSEYDALVSQMKSADPNHPVLSEVGADPTYGKKVTHPSLMGSLTKANYGEKDEDISELVDWRNTIDDEEIVCMPKIDGLAVRIVYKNGKIKLAATRGNGKVGQDVTDNVKKIKSIPNTINGFTGELRGEILMTKSDFQVLRDQMLKNGENAPANPRNMASGTLNQKDPKKTAKRPLHFLCYEIDDDENEFNTEMDKYLYAEKNLPGIEYVEMCVDSFSTPERLLNKIHEWEERRNNLDYCIDGLVFSANHTSVLEDLGYNGKCPVGKVAFKFRPQQAKAMVEGILWQLGRTGRLTPVAQISKTSLDGSVIDSPTLHNYNMIQKKGISIGAEVVIEKAGDIIPQVVRVTTPGTGDLNMPEKCPACGENTELDDDEVSLWCKNPVCPGKVEFRIIHYLKTLEVKDVGPAAVRSMLDAGIISNLPGLYNIDFEKLSSLPGYGSKSARKIVKAIYDKKEIELSTFLDSLGIEGLGTTTSKLIATEFQSLKNILRIGPDKLVALEGIGDITANAICNGLANLGGIIDGLIEAGVKVKSVEKIEGNLSGKTFCITGTLSVGRKEMAALIESAGGTIKSSVGKGLDFLVAGDNVGKGKTDKAAKYGTKVISEEEIRKMI